MTETIQQLKEDIAVLQEKLNKLEEIEKQSKITFENEGKFEIVSYNDKCYVRMDYSYDALWYVSKNTKDFDGNNLILITDDVTRNVLEGLWYGQVKKDEPSMIKPSMINCFIEGNPPNGYSSWSEWFEELGSKGILHNLKISSKDFKEKVEEPTKPMDEVVERLRKKYEAQKLYNRLFELGYDEEDCDAIVDLVEDWLPEPQNTSGSQNVNTELLVEGFNDCVRKMKEMIR